MFWLRGPSSNSLHINKICYYWIAELLDAFLQWKCNKFLTLLQFNLLHCCVDSSVTSMKVNMSIAVSMAHLIYLLYNTVHSLRMLLCPVIPIGPDKAPSSLPSDLPVLSLSLISGPFLYKPFYIPTSALKVDTACS